ncbi:sensor histidine kinase [Actinocorallia sp. A-T 12471]|uniref:sensor histidine kinase n=1 Tax=Actinocorallia sp. A-T 12471 TaxID=3089813 RepID=UPI0029CDE2EF|nr:sensor histidine kinase [Actinocorallia sp. A-T 12471]MDX6743386.1 sensor histidine kinase [Actinocorallia sp. A-T 12471]
MPGDPAGRLLAAAGAGLPWAGVVTVWAGRPWGEALLYAVGGTLIPAALLRVVRPRPSPGVLRAADAAVACCALLCAVGTAAGWPWVVGTAAVAGLGVLVCAGWLLYEVTSGDDRRRVLWVVLGAAAAIPPALVFQASADTLPLGEAAVGGVFASLVLVLPLAAAVSLVSPRAFDIRAVMHAACVHGVMLLLTVAVYLGGEALATMLRGGPPTQGTRLLLVAAVALGYEPVRRRLGATMDELLFGGSADPVSTMTLLGSDLADGSEPARWLHTLREALGVPGVALRVGDGVVAMSGEVGSEAVATPLRVGAGHVGELVVMPPAERLGLPAPTAAIVALVAAPLAQALHAMRLSEELRASRGRVVAALEEERRRTRRDLHDGLGPTLTGIAYAADAAANLVAADPARALETLRQLRADAGDAIAEVRRIVYGLRPKALDELGLTGAIRQRVSGLHTASGVPLDVAVTAPERFPPLPAAVEVVAYRVAVEALTNVARHAPSPTASLTLALDDGHLHITVTDPGSAPAPWTPGVGLTAMRERIEHIGGTLSLHPSPSHIHARLPLHLPHAPT